MFKNNCLLYILKPAGGLFIWQSTQNFLQNSVSLKLILQHMKETEEGRQERPTSVLYIKWIYFIIYIVSEETEVESYHTLQRVKALKLTENRKHKSKGSD